MKTRAFRAMVVLISISITSMVYAIGLQDVLPATNPAGRHIPEFVLLFLLGITLLLVGHHGRRRTSIVPASTAPRLRLRHPVSMTADLSSLEVGVK